MAQFARLVTVAAIVGSSIMPSADCFAQAAGAAAPAGAVPAKLTIEFKVFPANAPTDPPLEPLDVATIRYRSKLEGLPDIKFDLKVSPVAGKPGFFQVEVDKGWLIEQVLIRVKRPGVNPAVIAKVVSANNMIVYPGASDSMDTFKFHTYMAQMNTYKDLFIQFVDEAPLVDREMIRQNLLKSFDAQLRNMTKLNERLTPETTLQQRAAARKLLQEVIRLYYNIPTPRPQVYSNTPRPQVYPDNCCSRRWCRLRCR